MLEFVFEKVLWPIWGLNNIYTVTPYDNQTLSHSQRFFFIYRTKLFTELKRSSHIICDGCGISTGGRLLVRTFTCSPVLSKTRIRSNIFVRINLDFSDLQLQNQIHTSLFLSDISQCDIKIVNGSNNKDDLNQTDTIRYFYLLIAYFNGCPYIFLIYYYITIYVCVPNFYDLSALVGCWSSVSIRRIIYKFLNVCTFDYMAVAVSGKVERS